ncbi:hypothetical protein [Aquabacter sediminis]|uniref:hypothetical protein n=1 Tax=Aquabacter sediminis TaxID=3029197 RepID=UPI00237EC5DD|nr:hypothetical protein [Aquabacter sp. P-9]MDE1567428.1 hypothetical protein [Aquabacter sp. P-9]
MVQRIPVAGLLARSDTVYKWKAPLRCWVLRELVFWRVHDLMHQSYVLHTSGHGLGARILVRSGFETLSLLIYMNFIMRDVVDGRLDFFVFERKTCELLIGSRDELTPYKSINILTILSKCDDKYPGLVKIYQDLSESAHPNWGGMGLGYSVSNSEEFETDFSNNWMKIYGEEHISLMKICMDTFIFEYDSVWIQLMDRLEAWIEVNDSDLEAARSAHNEKSVSSASDV